MIDVKDLIANPEKYRKAVVDKGMKEAGIDTFLYFDKEWRANVQILESRRAALNETSATIGKKMREINTADLTPEDKEKQLAEVENLKGTAAVIRDFIENQEAKVEQFRKARDQFGYAMPQPADEDVPVGKDDTENVEVAREGNIPDPTDVPKSHIELGLEKGLIDFERGVKVAGTRNYFLTGQGVMLQRAILNLAMDFMVGQRGFTPMTVPTLVREKAMEGTGYFPTGRDQTYETVDEDNPLFLTGTAEVPLTAFHMGETLNEEDLPRKYVAQSSCYRKEAGSAGKDAKGLYRVHQFEKVEQVVICKNDKATSAFFHEDITSNSVALLKLLGLPYRLMKVCTGDLGIGQAAKYDIEVWMPSRGAYGETHSASKFYDFQARRLNLKYKDKEAKTYYCHTLNNTVIAAPRILIPLLELNQKKDGTISIPKALQKYMNGITAI